MADSQDQRCEERSTDCSVESPLEEQTPQHQGPPQNDEGGSSPPNRLHDADQEEVPSEKEREEDEEDYSTSDTTGDEEEVDPRVAENLEIMNQCCAEVNRLENELDEARAKYRSTFQTCSQRMEELGGKIKKNIQRARHYFELTDKAKQAQNEAVRAARLYQTANSNYRAAIEMVTLAEKGLDDTCTNTRTLSSAWQETLNHAVEKVTVAEREKSRSETEHNKKAAVCAQLESQIHFQEKKYKRSISKARPYFETKAELELKLQQLKQNVWDLQHAIGIRKTRYADALRCLEAVSTEIHESRLSRNKLMLQLPREPGVGAETDSLGSSISDANIERNVFSSTGLSVDDDDEDEESDDVGDVFSRVSDSSCQPLSKSLSKCSASKQQDAEDSRSVCSHASDNVFSRSISSASVFSSESQSDSAAESLCSPTVEKVPMNYPGVSLMDLARGDLGSRQQNNGTAAVNTCENGADPISTCTMKDMPDPADCQREAGDGSALEDCATETDRNCSQLSSVLSSSPQQHISGESQSREQSSKAADIQCNGAGLKTTDMMPAVPQSQAVKGEIKKTPLRRTDTSAHKPLQGVMLLNPSDLAASSVHFGPRI